MAERMRWFCSSCAFAVHIFLFGLPQAAYADHEGVLFDGKVLSVESRVLDLVSTVQDIGGEGRGLAGQAIDLHMKETSTEIHIELSGDVLFDFDKADILPKAEATLNRVAEVIRAHPGARVIIDGYTDAKGAADYNLTLSRKRAAAVKEYLVRRNGADARLIDAHGYGKDRPVAPNQNPDGSDNPDGRQKNRRVEITVKK